MYFCIILIFTEFICLQARPNDYAVDYLASHKIVSFHKHWMVNPESVYQKWFAEDDSKFSELNTHEEL